MLVVYIGQFLLYYERIQVKGSVNACGLHWPILASSFFDKLLPLLL